MPHTTALPPTSRQWRMMRSPFSLPAMTPVRSMARTSKSLATGIAFSVMGAGRIAGMTMFSLALMMIAALDSFTSRMAPANSAEVRVGAPAQIATGDHEDGFAALGGIDFGAGGGAGLR